MMYIKFKKPPCSKCRKPKCEEINCDAWRDWFTENWNAMHQVAQREALAHQHQQQDKFLVGLPHETDPCRGCVRSAWCEVACSARLMWWDRSMARIRRALS